MFLGMMDDDSSSLFETAEQWRILLVFLGLLLSSGVCHGGKKGAGWSGSASGAHEIVNRKEGRRTQYSGRNKPEETTERYCCSPFSFLPHVESTPAGSGRFLFPTSSLVKLWNLKTNNTRTLFICSLILRSCQFGIFLLCYPSA